MGSKLRLRFCKTGKAKYISHLDLMATMRRALLRAGVKLSYSEGFNPHPYISVALPLPVGCGSICELMDIESASGLLPDGLQGLITAALPEGIEVLEVYTSERKFRCIAWLELHGILFYDKGAHPCALNLMAERLASQSLIIIKKTKRGESNIDIGPFIRDTVLSMDNGNIDIKVKVSAQNPTITVKDIINAMSGTNVAAGDGIGNVMSNGMNNGNGMSNGMNIDISPDYTAFSRIEVFDSEMNTFR